MKRILTIDGGGIKGAWPAAFLAVLEESTGVSILDSFDLVVGTSTGGIIALGIGLGLSTKEILQLYTTRGSQIFEPAGPLKALRRTWRTSGKMAALCNLVDSFSELHHLRRTKYTSDHLRDALTDVFGNRTLGESQTRLVIPAFNAQIGKVYLFKTAHHPHYERDYRAQAVDVALATAAAPTYFPPHTTQVGSVLVDGGVWANNPVGLAVVEAISTLQWPADDIRVLSLGCTEQPLAVPGNLSARWLHLPHVIELMMQGQAQGSLGTAKLLLGHSDTHPRLYRRSQTLNRNMFKLDSVKLASDLGGLGATDAREFLPIYREVFLPFKREPFVPFHH